MGCSSIDHLELVAGETFELGIRWEDRSSVPVYKPITAITKAVPAAITAAAHGLPPKWLVAVTAVKGMVEINAQHDIPLDGDFTEGLATDANTISLPFVNSANYSNYTSGGYVMYYPPVDMSGYTARMSIRQTIESNTVIDSFSTSDARLPNTGIVLDFVNKLIRVKIADSVTEDYNFRNAYYSLEAIDPLGKVTRVAFGRISCTLDVTR